MRAGWAVFAAIVLGAAAADIAAAQDLFPPGHGWTSLGACALIDSGTSPITSLVPGEHSFGTWLAGSRPYSIKGVTYLETAGSVEAGSGTIALWWRELEGDGMRLTHLGLAATLPVIPESSRREPPTGKGVWLTAGFGVERLGGAGSHSLRTCVYRIGSLVLMGSGWRMGILHRAGIGRQGLPVRSMQTLSLGHQGTPFSVSIGGLRVASQYLEPSLTISFRRGPLRFDAGGWGSPPSPSAGIRMSIAGFEWRVECRWVLDFGTYTLWSVSLPRGLEG